MKFTLSVKSFQVPPTPGTYAWPPSLPSVPTSRATRVTSEANERSWSTITLMVSFSSQDLAAHVDRDLLRQVAVGHRGGHLGDVRKARRPRLAPRVESLEGRLLLSGADVDPASTLLVRFRDGTSLQTQRTLLNTIQGSVIESYPQGASLVQVNSPSQRASAIKTLTRNRSVLYAEVNATIQATAIMPNDPGFYKQTGLDNPAGVDIRATTAWETTQGSSATIVAVIDSGLDLTHPEFAGRVWVNEAEANGVPGRDDDGDGLVDDVNGWNYLNNNAYVQDDNGHGTHVTGIIAASGNNGVGLAGINWNTRIMPLKFIGSDGNGSVDDAIKAIYYAVDHVPRVINASWGGNDKIRALTDAIQYANNHNVVFVTAAGNESVNNGVFRSYPANDRLPNVISVAAVDSNGALASFSNYGVTTVDIAAPGVNIRSTVPGGYATYSGTSMAAPFVTGVVSLLVGMHPELKASQLVQRVLNAARPLPGLQNKVITGGIVDAANTVSDAYAATHPGPTSLQALRRLKRLRKQQRIQVRRMKKATRNVAVHKPVQKRDVVRVSFITQAIPIDLGFVPDVVMPVVEVETDA